MSKITLVLPASCSNENYDVDIAIVEITKAELDILLARAKTAKKLHANDPDLVKLVYWSCVYFANSSERPDDVVIYREDEVVEGKIPESDSADVIRTDCDQIHITDTGSAYWTAYDHHTSDYLSTESVKLSSLLKYFKKV